jgi:RNA polymerase sigma-70 factor (ECF subfamily)
VPSDKDAIYVELLALRCRRGERSALEELIRTWERPLFYFIRRLVRTEADAWDVLQMTWVKALRGLASLKEPRNLVPWLYRIARNTAIDHGHLQASYHALLENYDDVAAAGDDPGGFDADDVEQLHRALDRLSLPHREVLTLFFLEDLSIDQVAEALDVPPGTVKSRLHYAKQALRALLEKED